MTKVLKTAEELKDLLDKAVAPYSLAGDAQWIKIVPTDPKVEGANWTVAYTGGNENFAAAIARVTPKLQENYDLAPEE